MNNVSKYLIMAHSRGFSGCTVKGAIKFLREHKPAPNTTPIYARGVVCARKKIIKESNPSYFLSQLNPYPYRVSESNWAGGDHRTRWVLSTTPNAYGGSDRVWSANGKWSGTDSYAVLSVTARAIAFLKGNMIIGGLVTLDLERVAPRQYRAVWAEQSRGVSLKTVHGWIIRGHHVTGGTLEVARKKAAKARKLQLESAIAQRDQRRSHRDYKRVWIGVEDSLAAGNCPQGTAQMQRLICRALGGDIGAVRADVLLKHRDDHFTRRAVAYAASHH